MKIVHISTYTESGAGIAAVRLNQALISNGMDSSLITLAKSSPDPALKVINGNSTTILPGTNPAEGEAVANWHKIVTDHPGRPWGLEMFSNPDSSISLQNIEEIRQADIVHLHWVAGMVDYAEMALALAGKKVVWTLHDMNPFTGGCHYSNFCNRYMQSCGACPQLGSMVEDDLSRINWNKKKQSIRQLDVSVVTPSRWLAGCAVQSSIFSSARVANIPNGISVDTFKPYNRSEARELFQVSDSAGVILFGADSIANSRKGFAYLMEALKRHHKLYGCEVVLATFGSLDSSVVQDFPFPLIQLGRIRDENHLARIYSMADMTVVPSLEDNLPNIVLESMACGTPVAGFNVGGIPDMVDHQSTGYLATHGDVDDLVSAIQWLLVNGSGLMRKKCRDKVELRFSLGVFAERMAILYKSLSHPASLL